LPFLSDPSYFHGLGQGVFSFYISRRLAQNCLERSSTELTWPDGGAPSRFCFGFLAHQPNRAFRIGVMQSSLHAESFMAGPGGKALHFRSATFSCAGRYHLALFLPHVLTESAEMRMAGEGQPTIGFVRGSRALPISDECGGRVCWWGTAGVPWMWRRISEFV